jgi:hypothetical protein
MKKIEILSILLALLLTHISSGLEARETAPPTDSLILLKKEFLNPPNTARPWVYWFWINNCVTCKGITADLEAMKRVGIAWPCNNSGNEHNGVMPCLWIFDVKCFDSIRLSQILRRLLSDRVF